MILCLETLERGQSVDLRVYPSGGEVAPRGPFVWTYDPGKDVLPVVALAPEKDGDTCTVLALREGTAMVVVTDGRVSEGALITVLAPEPGRLNLGRKLTAASSASADSDAIKESGPVAVDPSGKVIP